jgi:hypothetical protein
MPGRIKRVAKKAQASPTPPKVQSKITPERYPLIDFQKNKLVKTKAPQPSSKTLDSGSSSEEELTPKIKVNFLFYCIS